MIYQNNKTAAMLEHQNKETAAMSVVSFAAGFWDVAHRPFSIVLVKLAFNATRNSRKKPKKC